MEERLGKVDVEASVFTCDPSLLEMMINSGVSVLVTCFGRRKTKNE